MTINGQNWTVDSVNLDSLANDIRNHELAGECAESVDRLLNACAAYLYGTATKKQLRVSFNIGKTWAEIPIE